MEKVEVEICSSLEEVVKEVEVTYRHRVGEVKGVEICKHVEEGVMEMVEVENCRHMEGVVRGMVVVVTCRYMEVVVKEMV